jgi:hypothetical protein
MAIQINALFEKYQKELKPDVEADRARYWKQASEAFHFFWKNKIMNENSPDLN